MGRRLYSKFRIVNFKRCKRVFHRYQGVKLQVTPPSPIADVPSALPFPTFLPPPVTPTCSLDMSPCMPTVSLYCKIKNALFFVFVHFVLCEKYCKSIIVQYYIADHVSWVPRLSLLDLQIGLMNMLSEWNSIVCRGLSVQTDQLK